MSLIKKPKYGKKKKILIVGVGEAGELIAWHIINHPNLNYHISCFIDDDPNKIGKRIFNVPIKGPIKNLKIIAKEEEIDEILIAIPSSSGELIKRIARESYGLKIDLKILPGSFRLLEKDNIGFENVRPVEIEDFFIKKPFIENLEKMKDYFLGKSILVTGGAGSIGSELCKQLLEFNTSRVVILDNAESPLHDLVLKLQENHKGRFIPVLADIRDRNKIKRVFEEYNPDIVFHVAAYKHVPMMEINSDEAIKNNVFGTKNLVDLSEIYNVKDFILISTDKAVNPSTIMGISKKLAEMIVKKKSQDCTKTKFISVRFGNVINSQGSVIPLFEKQIEQGGPITITHPNIKRFFMAINEAVNLIIQVPLISNSGDLFVLDMGEQIKISEIAEEMIRLKGFEPYEDIELRVIGLRKGEKLYEELYSDNEIIKNTENKRIFLIETQNSNYKNIEEYLKQLNSLLFENNLSQGLRDFYLNFIQDYSLKKEIFKEEQKQKNIKIVFVQPNVGFKGHTWEAIGIGYMTSYLKKYFKGDLDIEFYSAFYDSDETIIDACKEANIIGFSCTSPQFKHGVELAKKIKTSNNLIVFGGIHATILPEIAIKEECIDVVVKGEGEKPMLKIVEDFHKGIKPYKKVYEIDYVEDINSIPFPDREIIKNERNIQQAYKDNGIRITSILSTRGCPFKCTFCSSHCVWGKTPRARSYEDILDEFEYLINKWKIDFIKFADDTFTINKQRVIDFCKLKIKRGIKTPYGLNAHINTMDEEMLYWFAKSNCKEIWYGVESGSQKILNDMKKFTKIDRIKEIFKLTKKYGIKTRAYFLLGMPNETIEDIKSTEQLCDEIDPDIVGFSLLSPFPGNSYFNYEIMKDWDWSEFDEYDNKWVKTKTLSNEELKREQKRLVEKYQRHIAFRQKENTQDFKKNNLSLNSTIDIKKEDFNNQEYLKDSWVSE